MWIRSVLCLIIAWVRFSRPLIQPLQIHARFIRAELQLLEILLLSRLIIGDQQLQLRGRLEFLRQLEYRLMPEEIQDHEQPLILQRPGVSIDFGMLLQQESVFTIDDDLMFLRS